jgi:inorganic triphosphatase YgiF
MGIFDRTAGLDRAGFVRDGEARLRTVLDTYLDTADGRLRAAGLAARVRDELDEPSDPHRRLTVKSLASPVIGAVHDRLELEGPAGPALEPDAWPPSGARTMVIETTRGAPLEVIARIRQRRRTLLIRRGGTSVELSLDDLEALGPVGRADAEIVLARTTELEAELLDGDVRQLDALSADLLGLGGLRAATGSKLDWATAAVRAAQDVPPA